MGLMPVWLLPSLLLLFHLAPASTLQYRFRPLEHLGGVAPFFGPNDPGADPATPQGCTVGRASYLSRHAAIYANDFDYEEYIQPFISKWQNRTAINWTEIPSLNFLAGWSAPLSETELGMLTRVGKLEATQLGVDLSFRYPKLRLPARVWTSSAERTVKTAQSLVRGYEMEDNTMRVVQIYESKEAGADTLTPYKSCPAYSSSFGSEYSKQFLERFTRPITARLNALAPGFDFDADDVYGMMELCGYESVIRGSSPFCSLDLFSPDDWLGWEYTADVQSHYNVGYGNDVSGAIGLPWLNATAHILMGTDAAADQDMYISFTHRELPPTVLVAMGLFNNSAFGGTPDRVNDTMPLHRINHGRAWKSSRFMAFLSHVAMERLNCSGSHGYQDGDYYRVLVNSAPQPMPDCSDGPGTSCSRRAFETYLRSRVDMFGGFSGRCRVDYDNSTDLLDVYTDSAVGNGTAVGKRSPW